MTSMSAHDALLPMPPFVEVEGIHNFRDAGGYPVGNGEGRPPRSIRRGLLYRCADPSRITQTGKNKVQSLGVAAIFDLRAQKEIDQRGEEALRNIETIGGHEDDSGNGGGVTGRSVQEGSVKRVHIPAFPQQDSTPEGLAMRYAAYATGSVEGFTKAYRDILDAAGPSYGVILRHLLDHPTSPIIVHCTAGKDRTGLIIALILKLAGVEDEVVSQEYQLTEVGLGPMREEIVQHLLGRKEIGGEMNKALSMIGARKAYMMSTLHVLQEEFGGVENYMKTKCGLNDEEIARLKEIVTVEAAPIHYNASI